MTVLETPTMGAYLTDGKRLCMFVAVTDKGDFVLEDCSAPTDDPALVTVKADQLAHDWQVVRAA